MIRSELTKEVTHSQPLHPAHSDHAVAVDEKGLSDGIMLDAPSAKDIEPGSHRHDAPPDACHDIRCKMDLQVRRGTSLRGAEAASA